MRLTCPNCDAQYEVPDDVVPPEGRDVQCSNCGQTWFQHHLDYVSDDADRDAVNAPAPARQEPEPEPDAPPPPPSQPETRQAPKTQNKGLDDLDDLPDAGARPIAERRQLDPSVADILRQEAQAEQAARAEQAPDPDVNKVDTTETFGVAADPSEEQTLQARQRMARLRGEPEPMSEDDLNAAAASSRRDLLPDIDEINSTLRTKNDRSTHAVTDAPLRKKRKRGFRAGFLLMLIVLVVLALVYIYAPQIAQGVPQADPYLSSYVTWVDQIRQWLDGQVQGLLRWLDTMASQSGS